MNNNDLSMLLKSQVVKLKAELDVSGSLQDISNDIEKISKSIESKDIGIKIPIELYSTIEDLNKDVAEIQKRLKSSKSARKIELGVTLDANLKDLQKDISDLQTKLINSKTTKPIKLDVEINVQGSAGKIKEQFNTIQKVLEDFQKGYGGKLKDFSQEASNAIGGLVSKEALAKVSSGIEQVRKKMEEGFGEGVFSSKLVSDSEGNVERLVATMRNSTGEIQSLSYKWDDIADSFVLLKQQDVNNIEANTAKAKNAIQGLYNSLQSLSTTGATEEIRGQLDALGKMDSISMDAVKGIEGLIQKEKEYQAMTSKREVLYSKIDDMMRSVASESSVAYKSLAFLEDGIVSAKTITDLNNVEKSIKGISEAVKEENKVQELRQKLIDDITQKENQLAQVKLRSSGIDSDGLRTALQQADALTAEAREIANVATTTKELQDARAKLNEVTKQYISTANTEIAQEAQAQKVYKTVDDIEKMLFKLKDMNKMSSEELKKALVDLDDSASGGIAKLTRYGNSVKESLDDAEREARELIQPLTLLDNTMKDMSSRELRQNILKAVDNNDLDMLKKYVGELQGGTVNLAKMTNTLDENGRAVARVTATMESNGKTAEKYVIDIDRGAESASRAVRQVNEELVFNANRNLGVLEQMRIAIERVPIWHMAQTLFRGITQGSKQVVEEIMEVNSAMTEIQRVADSNLNLDSMLKSSVQQAKDLGTNIHDVLGALGESARTFGDFNEQALLAVNQTAIIMDNVSDLNLDQSMNSLIGTMNAFNISAEDSIHIVNAFNEVDNQFAISTQQIASGMEKSASTAKTFGLEMEEVIGHITSIGSVTMESGERIGNALKTIYARITTNDKAISALEQVEISINKISETGEVVTRETGDIIEELAGKWNTLSDAERQSLGVNIAGVNQLSRLTDIKIKSLVA